MPRRVLQGVVVEDKVDKTITVSVTRLVKHKLYGKRIRRSKKYLAHDEQNIFKKGQEVSILEHIPISKRKRWIVVNESAGAVSN